MRAGLLTRVARRTPGAAPAVLLVLALAGCVEVDGELAMTGALTLRYTYDPPIHATFKSERARLGSPHVRVENLERDRSLPNYPPKEFVTATLAVDDARQLSSAPAFADVQIDRDLTAGRLQVAFPGLDPEVRREIPTRRDGAIEQQALRVRLLLPGPVTRTEPEANVDGRSVTWTLTFRQLAALGDTVRLTVAWTPAAGS